MDSIYFKTLNFDQIFFFEFVLKVTYALQVAVYVPMYPVLNMRCLKQWKRIHCHVEADVDAFPTDISDVAIRATAESLMAAKVSPLPSLARISPHPSLNRVPASLRLTQQPSVSSVHRQSAVAQMSRHPSASQTTQNTTSQTLNVARMSRNPSATQTFQNSFVDRMSEQPSAPQTAQSTSQTPFDSQMSLQSPLSQTSNNSFVAQMVQHLSASRMSQRLSAARDSSAAARVYNRKSTAVADAASMQPPWAQLEPDWIYDSYLCLRVLALWCYFKTILQFIMLYDYHFVIAYKSDIFKLEIRYIV